MSEQTMSIRMSEERGDRLRRVMDATGENTKAKALDVAMNHYLADLANKERVADDLPGEHAEALSTPWLPIDRETRVGRSE
jgi:3-methyladenine DNA glycosylase Mpg